MPIDTKNPQVLKYLQAYNDPNQTGNRSAYLNWFKAMGITPEELAAYNGKGIQGSIPLPNPAAGQPDYVPPPAAPTPVQPQPKPDPGAPPPGQPVPVITNPTPGPSNPNQPANPTPAPGAPPAPAQQASLDKYKNIGANWDLKDAAIHDALEATSAGNQASNPNALTADQVSEATLAKMGITRQAFNDLLSQRDLANKSGTPTDLTAYFGGSQQATPSVPSVPTPAPYVSAPPPAPLIIPDVQKPIDTTLPDRNQIENQGQRETYQQTNEAAQKNAVLTNALTDVANLGNNTIANTAGVQTDSLNNQLAVGKKASTDAERIAQQNLDATTGVRTTGTNNVIDYRKQSLNDLAGILAKQQDQNRARAIPGLAENANLSGIFRSTGLGDRINQYDQQLSEDTANKLALQGVADRNLNAGDMTNLFNTNAAGMTDVANLKIGDTQGLGNYEMGGMQSIADKTTGGMNTLAQQLAAGKLNIAGVSASDMDAILGNRISSEQAGLNRQFGLQDYQTQLQGAKELGANAAPSMGKGAGGLSGAATGALVGSKFGPAGGAIGAGLGLLGGSSIGGK